MEKINKIIKITFSSIYILSIIYLIVKWNSIKDVIGVHFSLANKNNMLEFDVYDNKIYSLYPFIINGILLILTLFIDKITKRIKTGIKVSKKGETFLRYYIQIITYTITASAGIFFYSWIYCVVNQKFMSIIIPLIGANIIAFILLSILPTIITIKIIFNEKKKNKN